MKKDSQTMTWQPIETAPRDGTEVMFIGPCISHTVGYIVSIRVYPTVDSDGVYDNRGAEIWIELCRFSHWMPLPKPPKGEE